MHGFTDPAVLFFIFGVLAGIVKSNLEIPSQISRFLSLYLLMAIGLKGGFALSKSGLTDEVAITLACAVTLAVIIPLAGYRLLTRVATRFDAAAIAAAYGSVSAVTFITATQYLDSNQIAYGGHMAAALALMESPAIVIAVLLANGIRRSAAMPVMPVMPVMPAASGAAAIQALGGFPGVTSPIGKLLHESFTDGAQMLLLGALAIGMLTGTAGEVAMQAFTGDLFKGMLALFLLDMGLLASRKLGSLKGTSPWLLAYAVISPLIHAAVALGMSSLFGVSIGNSVLLMVLAASASYIAVPAAIRYAIPEANPSMYLGMSLALTFPFNIIFGIPLYTRAASLLS